MWILVICEFFNKYRKQLLDKGQDASKTASKKEVHEAAEAVGEFIGTKIADKIVKQVLVIDENSRNVKEIITLSEKREEILNKYYKTGIL